jgi:hypothetical protein
MRTVCVVTRAGLGPFGAAGTGELLLPGAAGARELHAGTSSPHISTAMMTPARVMPAPFRWDERCLPARRSSLS